MKTDENYPSSWYLTFEVIKLTHIKLDEHFIKIIDILPIVIYLFYHISFELVLSTKIWCRIYIKNLHTTVIEEKYNLKLNQNTYCKER